MRVDVLGVRGSTPAPGAPFVRYGGNTSCIALSLDGAEPTLVLDAGTGLRSLGRLLPDGGAFRGAILLTHLHWDHTHGLPFCPAVDHLDACVDLRLPEQGTDAEALLTQMMQPPHFPIRPGELRGHWQFSSIGEGVTHIDGFEILAREIPHKGGRTFGYRVSDGHSSMAYLPDHGPFALGPGEGGFGPIHPAAVALTEGVDLLLHDAQYTAAEFPAVANYGHSAVDYPIALAEAGGVGRLVLFHHDPNRTDDAEDALLASLRQTTDVALDAAHEGDSYQLFAAED
jgi:phosphoribosyl 1,2-cyclic phosphodiesterase